MPPVAVAARNSRVDELVKTIETSSNVHDPRILGAFRAVPRERFVPDELTDFAYDDRALPIGEGQTISQPSMIALMLEALAPAPEERALEVGAGSGYAAALLGQLTSEVEAIEIRPELAERAQRTLESLGVANVHVHAGNGALGIPTRAPFDVILVSAGARATPPELTHELAPGGRIAIPVGDEHGQHLFVGRRTPDGVVEWERRTACVFVPLVGGVEKRAARV
jgi:protein-L-isoaspartate(D-aspartate) O-methyltransferase